MDRRGFLKRLGVAGLVAVAAPELVLPRVRTYFFGGWPGLSQSASASAPQTPAEGDAFLATDTGDTYVRHDGRWVLETDVPPVLYGDGIHDDSAAIQWLVDRSMRLPLATYAIGQPIVVNSGVLFDGGFSQLLVRKNDTPGVILPSGTKDAAVCNLTITVSPASTARGLVVEDWKVC